MRERILVPFDGSPLSQRALERAITKHPNDQITVLYVIDPMLAVYEAEAKGLPAASTWYDRMKERADEICTDATEQATDNDCEITTATEIGRPARAILEYVDEHDIEHIIMEATGARASRDSSSGVSQRA